MKNIQEIEEAEFVHESDLSNCFREANDARRGFADKAAEVIKAELAAGRFVVVVKVPYYCRVSDAYAGEYAALRSSHASRAEADAARAAIGNDPSFDPECDGNSEVLPRLPLIEFLAAPAPADDDGVPF